jgi:hypothetical protein
MSSSRNARRRDLSNPARLGRRVRAGRPDAILRSTATKGTRMTQAIAYLAFNGDCADAIRFYERALGGKLEVLMSGADSPMAMLVDSFGTPWIVNGEPIPL